ncbi:hypothetical protein HaLaN_29265, partial [Haematococcus lacustris]
QLAAGAGAPPELLTSPAEQQGATSELDTSSTRKRRAGVRDRTQPAEQGAPGPRRSQRCLATRPASAKNAWISM